MNSDFLAERRKALEGAFFSKKDKELLEKLRAEMVTESKRVDLTAVTGIVSRDVLNDLIRMELNGETILALSLAPLVMVAWADGSVSAKERTALLSACDELGIPSQSAAHCMVEKWLLERPSAALLDTWKEYVSALSEAMSPASKAAFKDEVLGQAKSIAEAAGGVLGLGKKISKREQARIDELAAAFD